ncbi:oxidoreductase [Lithospermum erythrorhizon]|uniref:NADH dehydrogenase [ubiquinone] 1 alpha subcomplex subunit 12 n=1 Tax=Lithospermum erythrorhizon TaxID=34254 RepID=A0AAV3NME4_LITER
MSKLWSKLFGFFSKRSYAGMDKVGNRYFVRNEEIDGIIEWICWLNGQRKQAPTPEEMALFEARREQVRQNVARLKKEEEERKAKEGITRKPISNCKLTFLYIFLQVARSDYYSLVNVQNTAKVAGPNLKSFIQQFPVDSEGNKISKESESVSGLRESIKTEAEKEETSVCTGEPAGLSEPTGSGASYKPGTWKPPT